MADNSDLSPYHPYPAGAPEAYRNYFEVLAHPEDPGTAHRLFDIGHQLVSLAVPYRQFVLPAIDTFMQRYEQGRSPLRRLKDGYTTFFRDPPVDDVLGAMVISYTLARVPEDHSTEQAVMRAVDALTGPFPRPKVWLHGQLSLINPSHYIGICAALRHEPDGVEMKSIYDHAAQLRSNFGRLT